MRIKSIAISLLFILSIISILKTHGDVIVVNEGESIQQAINIANDGDIIYVKHGIYRENIIVNKKINLIGENAIIDGSGMDAIWVTVNHVNISGFQIINSTKGIYVFGDYVTIKKCWLKSNYCGIYISGKNCVIYLNNFTQNEKNACDLFSNKWDNGSIGNYWSDYEGKDENYDGIGDTPYKIDEDSMDNFPLMYPYGPPSCDFTYSINGKNVTFYGMAYDYDGYIVNYTWNFGDGSHGYGSYIHHEYGMEGSYNVCLAVMDNESRRNIECKLIYIDLTPPYTKYIMHPPEPNGKNGWYVSNVGVELIGKDNLSGVDKIFYRIDVNVYKEYKDIFYVEEEGLHAIKFYSVDKNGNIEREKSIGLKIDKSPPFTKALINGENLTKKWYKKEVDLILISSDNLSGVNLTVVNINGKGFFEYNGSISMKEGKHVIDFFSTDNAGNFEKVKRIEINVDKTLPNISIVNPSNGFYLYGRKVFEMNNIVIIGNISIIVSCDDNIGIEKVEFYIDGIYKANATIPPYKYEWDDFALGRHEIKAIAYDFAGNSKECEKEIFVINL